MFAMITIECAGTLAELTATIVDGSITAVNVINPGIGYDQEFLTDSVTMSDSVSLNASTAQSESVSVSDSVGFSFVVSSVFNANPVNLSQFNE